MTLSQTAILTKQIITISIIALILGTVSFIGYKIWYAYYLANLPPVEEKPDTKFGILPYPDFPVAGVSSSNFSYSVDTTTGGLPKVGDGGFEKIIKVYFITKSFATLLSPEKSQFLAEKFKITTPPQILSETNYRFTDGTKTLDVDLDSGNFVYRNEATISAKESLDDDNKLVSDFEIILKNLGILKPDLEKARTKVMLLKREGDTLIPTTLRTESIAAQISLWQNPLENMAIFTPDFNKSPVNAEVFKSSDELENYLSLTFIYFPVDTSTFATYPIKTVEMAFDDLKSGKGVVVIEPLRPNVSITSVYLGYFLSENYTPYLLPIFVFEGPNFAAYVSAVTEQFQSQTR